MFKFPQIELNLSICPGWCHTTSLIDFEKCVNKICRKFVNLGVPLVSSSLSTLITIHRTSWPGTLKKQTMPEWFGRTGKNHSKILKTCFTLGPIGWVSHPHFTGFSWLQSEMRLRNADSDKLTNRWNCTENNNKKWQSQTDNLVPVYSYRRYDKSHITLIYILADLYNDRKNCCTVCTALLYIFHILVLIQYAAVHWGLIALLLMCELHS